jgi:hypothetical protein
LIDVTVMVSPFVVPVTVAVAPANLSMVALSPFSV